MKEPNYENYSLEELYDALSNIDKDKYKNRYKSIKKFIKLKEVEIPESDMKQQESIIDESSKDDKKSIINPFLVLPIIFIIIVVVSLFIKNPDKESAKFRELKIAGIVDSVRIYPGIQDPQSSYVWINDKKYIFSIKYYATLIDFIAEGDSIYKDSGRWDIYVFKNKNGIYTETYFEGAKNYYK